MTASEDVRGFIVQSAVALEAGHTVLQLHGRLEDGRSFLVRDTGVRPYFYVESQHAARARGLGAPTPLPCSRLTLGGRRPVVRLEFSTPSEASALRTRLESAGISCHEADLRLAMRYLIDRGIRGTLRIRGATRPAAGVEVAFDDPQLEPAPGRAALRLLSLDIETDPQAHRLLSVALHGCGVSEVLLLTPAGWGCPPEAQPFTTERELLAALVRRVAELDPDILTGWNVVDFDLSVLSGVARRAQLPLTLGRGTGVLRLRPAARGGLHAEIPGRVVLDGLQLLRGAFIRMEDQSLDAVAKEVLGEGKLVSGHARADEILRMFEGQRSRFVEYNRTDARLVADILDKLGLLELSVERSRLTGLPLDRVSSSIAAFDSLYLAELGRRGYVARSVAPGPLQADAQAGGQVLEPLPGLYRNVLVFDFKSLYPSLIRTFQIDPLNLADPRAEDPIVAPSGAAFARQPGILTEMLDEIMPRREQARRDGDQVKSQALKILMNSFYGVLGTPACRFYDPRLANAITSFGRELLLWCRARLEAHGRRVLYGDTDSLFVLSGEPEAGAAQALGESLAAELNRDLAEHIQSRWRVPSKLELMFDRLYTRLYLPAVRHGTAGARKRYAGLVGGRVVFTGLEAVRGDWTPLAREAQRQLFARLFEDAPVEEYLRALVADLRAGRLDGQLVYRKSLRKRPDAYTTTTPPHVAAARKQGRTEGGRVAYVMTMNGAESAEARSSPLDYQHYVDKQLRAVAEPVLDRLGLDFERVIGDDVQLRLF